MSTNPKDLFCEYLDFDATLANISLSKVPTEGFFTNGKKTALETFHLAAKSVPAYKDFLKLNHINPKKIKSFDDFTKVPLTDKKNYLNKYPLKDLLLGGEFAGNSAITSSSGSSGTPFYWPRTPSQDFLSAKAFESLVVSAFEIHKKKTLHLNCSGLGVWTAGDYISMLVKYMSYKYPHNSSMCPGVDLESTKRVIIDLAPSFDQVVIYGYPPFIKDLSDVLPPRVFTKTEFKAVSYGELFPESWRNYVAKKFHVKDIPKSIVSLLGSSEGGMIGGEGPNAVLIRQEAAKNQQLSQALFNEDRAPTIVQFNPMGKFIEIVDGEIIMTFCAGLPLLRYNTKDMGGILMPKEIEESFDKVLGLSYLGMLKKRSISNNQMPFLYIFGRTDNTATIYGVNIFPELIKEAVGSKKVCRFLSGKFLMKTEYGQSGDQYLSLALELKPSMSENAEHRKLASEEINRLLVEMSGEFRKLNQSLGDKVFPKLSLHKFGDPKYFATKNKHKYLIK